jgi:hypothetical protein
MIRHLRACPEREKAMRAADASRGRSEPLVHLRVQDRWTSEFWLDLEVRGSATLEHLDRYLRAIWLECCDHLSRFSLGAWSGDEISPTRRIDRVFREGVEVTHIYDFGTSSETLIRCVDLRRGVPTTRHPIVLLARNLPPDDRCMECGQPASWLCMECVYEENTWGVLCDRHAESHPHDGYGAPVPLVNSPRLGMCGYTGPAEPPY